MSIRSKKDVEIILSKLKSFDNPSFELEQYVTPSSIAATWIWDMFMHGEVEGKIILDAGCGPGILGLGLLLLGAKKMIFLDKDKSALAIAKENYAILSSDYELGKAEFIECDIKEFNKKVDVVIQNPPFGTKDEHADKSFLEIAFKSAPLVYSMHKSSTVNFVRALAKDYQFIITSTTRFEFPIKATYHFHTKPVKKVDVTLFRLEKVS